jgi:hypothetical protein
MLVKFELCPGTCPNCGADLDKEYEPSAETAELTCGTCGCQIEFQNGLFVQWLDGILTNIGAGARVAKFARSKAKAA